LGIFPEPSVAPGGVSLNLWHDGTSHTGHGPIMAIPLSFQWPHRWPHSQYHTKKTVVSKLITHTHMAMVIAWYRRIVSQPSSFFGVSENRVQIRKTSAIIIFHIFHTKLPKLWGSSGRPPFCLGKPGKTSQASDVERWTRE